METGMGFALSHMAKCGWKEGQGLGREETGMKEAIKVKLKFDNSGFGHDQAEEFKFQWWDHVFNKAADNISVSKNKEGSIELQRKEELVVSKSRPSAAALMKEKLYGSFVKGATLHGSEEVSTASAGSSDDDSDDETRDMSMKLSDDQLFKLCGGKTAHKGARHGLNMNAKLERIRQQEEELMNKWKVEAQQDSPITKRSSSKQDQDLGKDDPNTKKKKKSKSKENFTEEIINSENVESKDKGKDCYDEEITYKKKKKKSKKLDSDEMNDSNIINEAIQDVAIIKKKKKKDHKRTFEDSSLSDKEYDEEKKRRKKTGEENRNEKKILTNVREQERMTDSGIESIEPEITNGESIRKKKKRKNKESNEDSQESKNKLHTEDFGCESEGGKHKKKKKSKKHNSDNATSDVCLDISDVEVKKKKKKEKKNKEKVSNLTKENEDEIANEQSIFSTTEVIKKKKKKSKKEKVT